MMIFSVTNLKSIRFFFYKKKNFLLLESLNKSEKIFSLPSFINFKIIEENIVFELKDTKFINKYNIFISVFSNYLSNNVLKKKLYLKGLGFKMNCDMIRRKLELKLGFSHLVVINIPLSILKVNIFKNCLIVECTDNVVLGNFIRLIRNLKAPDAYKGKGFFFKYQKDKLKSVKKK